MARRGRKKISSTEAYKIYLDKLKELTKKAKKVQSSSFTARVEKLSKREFDINYKIMEQTAIHENRSAAYRSTRNVAKRIATEQVYVRGLKSSRQIYSAAKEAYEQGQIDTLPSLVEIRTGEFTSSIDTIVSIEYKRLIEEQHMSSFEARNWISEYIFASPK